MTDMKLRKKATRIYRDESDSDDNFTSEAEEEEVETKNRILYSPSIHSEDFHQDTDDSSDCVILTSPTIVTSLPPISLLKEAPFRTIRTMDAIYDFTCDRVKNQPALITISSILSAAINRSLLADPSKVNKVDAFMLAGTSGCGKTETVYSIKHLLGMDPGYEFANQYVFIDGSTMSEPMQTLNLCGAPSGTVGCGDGTTIADDLNKAINKPPSLSKQPAKKKQPSLPMLKKTKSVSPSRKEQTVIPHVPPPFVLLFIDEFHMVSPDFMKAINGLIDTGEYETPNKKAKFVKPRETTLFIIFTSNYGATAIDTLKPRNDSLACQYIDEDMRSTGVCTYTIGRLGTICPYYPLEPTALRALLRLRLEEHVQKTPLAVTFGKNSKIRVTEEAKNILISHVIKRVNSDLGVRSALKELFQKIDLLAEKAFSLLLDENNEDEEELVFTGHSFPLNLFNNEEDDDECHIIIQNDEWLPIITLIKKNPANAQALTLYHAYGDMNSILDTMGMKKGTRELCQFVIPVNIAMNNHRHHNDEEIEDKVHLLEEKLERIADLIRKSDANNRHTIIDRIKEEVLPEEEFINKKKRKAEEEEEENHLTHTIQKKARVLIETTPKQSKRGPRPKTIDGFTANEYNVSKKRYSYSCNTCNAIIDGRRIGTHMCEESL